MSVLLRRQLHEMINLSSKDNVMSSIQREDVCRFILHLFMDNICENGLISNNGNAFELIIDWSKQLNVGIDDNKWKIDKNPIKQKQKTIEIPKAKPAHFMINKNNKTNAIITPVTPMTTDDENTKRFKKIIETPWTEEDDDDSKDDHGAYEDDNSSKAGKTNSEIEEEVKFNAYVNYNQLQYGRLSLQGRTNLLLMSRSRAQSHNNTLKLSKTSPSDNVILNVDDDDLSDYIEWSESRSVSKNVSSVKKSVDFNYLYAISHSIWIKIALLLDTKSKLRGLCLVSREMNLLIHSPLCWHKLLICIDSLLVIPKHVVLRSFGSLLRFELNWNNPQTPLSLMYDSNMSDYACCQYTSEMRRFFENLSFVCGKTLHTFKLSLHGGPFRLANSAPHTMKFFQTQTLLHLIFNNFPNLRKFKMDCYNLVDVDCLISIFSRHRLRLKLEFFECQVVCYSTLESPVVLSGDNNRNILPSTLRHLCLPLLADDSWIINQHLPNLQYLFFFGYSRSSAYALHENNLTVKCLDYIAGQKNIEPNCPKIKQINIALRQTDYLAIILRPVLRKLFKRCRYLKCVNLATAGNLSITQSLYKSLQCSNLQYCTVKAIHQGTPQKPIGVVQFLNINHNNNPQLNHDDESIDTVSEMAIGGRLRPI